MDETGPAGGERTSLWWVLGFCTVFRLMDMTVSGGGGRSLTTVTSSPLSANASTLHQLTGWLLSSAEGGGERGRGRRGREEEGDGGGENEKEEEEREEDKREREREREEKMEKARGRRRRGRVREEGKRARGIRRVRTCLLDLSALLQVPVLTRCP